MSTSTNNPNGKNTFLNTAVKKENLSYIKKLELPADVAYYIDSHIILNDIYIDDTTTASDIELNSRVLGCLKSYLLDSNMVLHMILEVFSIHHLCGSMSSRVFI